MISCILTNILLHVLQTTPFVLFPIYSFIQWFILKIKIHRATSPCENDYIDYKNNITFFKLKKMHADWKLFRFDVPLLYIYIIYIWCVCVYIVLTVYSLTVVSYYTSIYICVYVLDTDRCGWNSYYIFCHLSRNFSVFNCFWILNLLITEVFFH